MEQLPRSEAVAKPSRFPYILSKNEKYPGAGIPEGDSKIFTATTNDSVAPERASYLLSAPYLYFGEQKQRKTPII